LNVFDEFRREVFMMQYVECDWRWQVHFPWISEEILSQLCNNQEPATELR
jgi:hypothetical protein